MIIWCMYMVCVSAFCKNQIDQRWYEYDDTTVRPVEAKDVVTKAAYLLFYQHKQLTNLTIDNILNKSHWVYDVNEPSASIVAGLKASVKHSASTSIRPPTEERPSAVPEVRNGYSELYVNKVNIGPVVEKREEVRRSEGPVSHARQEVRGPDSEDVARRHAEAALLEELRRDRSPTYDEGEGYPSLDQQIRWEEAAPGSRQTAQVDVQRRDDMGINSPRVQSGSSAQSPRRELFPSQLSKGPNQKQTVAEQILKSKGSLEHNDNLRQPPRVPPRAAYTRSDSGGSGRMSGSDGSSPPSPNEPGAQLANSPRPVQKHVLNNERSTTVTHGVPTNNVKVKVYSNQINTQSTSKTNSGKSKAAETSKGLNQKVSNTILQTSNKPPDSQNYRNVTPSTPAPVRVSPPSPSRGYSTPQPVRRSFPPEPTHQLVERQISMPASQAIHTGHDAIDGHIGGLEIHGQAVPQVRTLPYQSVRNVTDKPPLPRASNSSRPPTASVTNGYDVNSHKRSGSASRGQSSSSRPLSVHNPREERPSTRDERLSARDERPSARDEPPSARGERPSRRDGDHGRSQQRSEVRMRNRSADRLMGKTLKHFFISYLFVNDLIHF